MFAMVPWCNGQHSGLWIQWSEFKSRWNHLMFNCSRHICTHKKYQNPFRIGLDHINIKPSGVIIAHQHPIWSICKQTAQLLGRRRAAHQCKCWCGVCVDVVPDCRKPCHSIHGNITFCHLSKAQHFGQQNRTQHKCYNFLGREWLG